MSGMPKIVVLTGFVLLNALAAQAKQEKPKPTEHFVSASALPATDRQHLLQDRFVLVKTVQAIPPAVRSHLSGQDARDGMADAGQPFQMTDVVTSARPLPFRRLIFAALSPGYCLVYNERGGYGYGAEVSVYRLSAGRAALAWKAAVRSDRSFLSLSQLQSRLGEAKSDKPAVENKPGKQ